MNQPLLSLEGCECTFAMECSFTDRLLLILRQMPQSQAVKGLEETCRILVFKSLLGKGLTEPEVIGCLLRE